VLCELVNNDNIINKDLTKEGSPMVFGPLNSLNIVGELLLPVANPMLKTGPGAWWDMNIISEDFGLIDTFHITIPKDLAEQKPLGDSIDVYKMRERPPCLLDLGYETTLTWRLRFNVDDCEIVVKSNVQKGIEIKKPKKKIHGIEIAVIFRKRNIDRARGIEIQ
jgi:hypothetical protein